MKRNIQIKICGMRDPDNVAEISGLNPEYLGFIFYPGSKRVVSDQVPAIPQKIRKVGVFVNADIAFVQELVKKYKLDMVQLHGDESPKYCVNLKNAGIAVIKAFRITPFFEFNLLGQYEKGVRYFLFDAAGKNYGGNGIMYDWNILKNYQGKIPFFLSGGISPEAAEQVKTFEHPQWIGVDLNSGFESEPGVKKYDELKSFMHAIRG